MNLPISISQKLMSNSNINEKTQLSLEVNSYLPMKFCPKCKKDLPLNSFSNNKLMFDSKNPRCKKCCPQNKTKVEIPETFLEELKNKKNFPMTFTDKQQLIYWCILNLDKEEKSIIRKNLKENTKALPIRLSKPDKLGRIPKKVYIFDAEGVLINQYNSVYECAKKLKTSRQNVENCIRRKNLALNKFYFSTTEDFEMPVEKVAKRHFFGNKR